MPSPSTIDTREALLDAALGLVQTRGYNAVSYRDLAEIVGIKTASIHYHFPAKADLGVALVRRYSEAFACVRQSIDDRTPDAAEKLRLYVRGLCDSFKRSRRLCLGAMLAAESSSLPKEVADEVRVFYAENEAWLAATLAEGRGAARLRFPGAPDEAGRNLFAGLEGALTAAWAFNDARRLASAGKWLVDSIVAG